MPDPSLIVFCFIVMLLLALLFDPVAEFAGNLARVTVILWVGFLATAFPIIVLYRIF